MSGDSTGVVSFASRQRVRPAGKLAAREEPCGVATAAWTVSNQLAILARMVEAAARACEMSGMSQDQIEEALQSALDIGIRKATGGERE